MPAPATPPPTRLAALLDIGPAVHQRAGLSRYARRLAEYFVSQMLDELDIALLYNVHSGHQPPSSLRGAPSVTFPLGQYAWRLSVLASQALRVPYWPLERAIRTRFDLSVKFPRPVVYHATEHLLPRLTVPSVLTVHDLIFERFPEHHTAANRAFLRVGMPLFVRNSSTIIAVSQSTRQDLVSRYGTDASKIHVVHEGIDPGFHPAGPDEVERVRALYSPDRPYLLMVGTLEPRKNHATAMAALARLRSAGFQHRLLVVGGQGWRFAPSSALVAQMDLEDRVSFVGYVPDVDLPPLYTGAACVLVPSLYEGFGFPVLEAMACAAPVICSTASSLPEVAGDAALLVPPLDDVGLSAAIRRVLEEPGLAGHMRERGLPQAAAFQWETCARQTVELYRLAAGL